MGGNKPEQRVKLSGGPEQTVSSIFVDELEALVFEFFDFSPSAQEHFGNDIAITIVVSHACRGALAVALGLPENARADAILEACSERFQSYFDVQPFLERSGIPFEKKFDAWA